MKKAAVYARVSSEEQEEEETFPDTQGGVYLKEVGEK